MPQQVPANQEQGIDAAEIRRRITLVKELVTDAAGPDDPRLHEASETVESVIAYGEVFPDLHFIRAAVDVALGDWPSVETSIRRYLQAAPEDELAHSWLARALEHQEKWPELLEAAQRYRACAPRCIDGLQKLILALGRTGREDEAVQEADRAIAAFPDLDINRSPGFNELQACAIARGLPAVLVSTQFKSGSLFISDTLCNGLALPSCYVSLAGVSDKIVESQLRHFARGGALCQQHFLPTPETFASLRDVGISRFITHVRDPRQSMVSAVHHFAKHYSEPSPLGASLRAQMPAGYDELSVQARIDRFLSELFADQVDWLQGWLEEAENETSPFRIRVTRFEEMIRQPEQFFDETLAFYEIPPEQFDRSALKLDDTKEIRHFRSGRTDEWKDVLSEQQQRDALAIMRRRGLMLYG